MPPQMTEKSRLLTTTRSADDARLPQHVDEAWSPRRRTTRSIAWAVLAALCFGSLFKVVLMQHRGHDALSKDPDTAVKQILKSTPVIVSKLACSCAVAACAEVLLCEQDGHIGMMLGAFIMISKRV